MQVRIRFAAALACLLLPAPAFPQTIPGDVTFEFPVNLTRLPPEITKVQIGCSIASDAFGTRTIRGMTRPNTHGKVIEVPVSAGRVVMTARIVVGVPLGSYADPTGKSANYECYVMGFSSARTGGGWNTFAADHANPAFRVSPTPQNLTGTFVW